MAQGLTVTTLLLRTRIMPKTESKMNIEPPTTAAQIRTMRCFDLELFLINCPGVEAGEGVCDGLETGGVEIIVGGFTGTGEAGVGAIKGEGEGVRKLLEGDGEGEFDDGDGEGEFEDGDDENGEAEGGLETENGDGDGEADMDDEPLPVSLAFPTLDGCGSSATCCNLR